MSCCNYCHRDCCDGSCRPAHLGCDFDIQANPFDASVWNVVTGGVLHRVKIPPFNETLTSLSLDYGTGTLTYHPERGKDQVFKGSQLGDLIDFDDLRDVDIDDSLAGHCYEIIFRKYNDCGAGCQSAADKWMNWNINSEGAKQNGIQYVRGANAYGCPVYLDVPTDSTEYWWGMWRPNDTGTGVEFGYIQPTAGTLPTDSNGDYIVISQDMDTKRPIYGVIPKAAKPFDNDDTICSRILPANGIAWANDNPAVICYDPNYGMAKIEADFIVTEARGAQTYFDFIVGTIEDNRLWPQTNYTDLAAHAVWENNSDGKILPVRLRFDTSGHLLLSGYVTARATSGKSSYIVDGLDDISMWYPVGV